MAHELPPTPSGSLLLARSVRRSVREPSTPPQRRRERRRRPRRRLRSRRWAPRRPPRRPPRRLPRRPSHPVPAVFCQAGSSKVQGRSCVRRVPTGGAVPTRELARSPRYESAAPRPCRASWRALRPTLPWAPWWASRCRGARSPRRRRREPWRRPERRPRRPRMQSPPLPRRAVEAPRRAVEARRRRRASRVDATPALAPPPPRPSHWPWRWWSLSPPLRRNGRQSGRHTGHPRTVWRRTGHPRTVWRRTGRVAQRSS